MEKAVTVKTAKRQAYDNLPASQKPWLFSKGNKPGRKIIATVANRKLPTLLERFDKALKQGGGDKVVREFMKSERKKFFELYTAMQPKNISVKQDHTIHFVELPPKQNLPMLPDPEIIDVGFDAEGVHRDQIGS